MELAEKEEGKGSTSATPNSASSSPSHDFSFTISLHSSSTTTEVTTPEKIKQSPLAIDLTPADEIFFHGHLLPLHFLSHLHAASSPRHSTNSMDCFTLPIRDMLQEGSHNKGRIDDDDDHANIESKIRNFEPKGRKPFSLFGLSKWRKGSDSKERENRPHDHHHQQQQQQEKRKVKFDVSQFVKRYVKMVKPLLTSKGGGGERRESVGCRRQPYSFSGTASPRDRRDISGRRGEFSAPASMRASPTNSGVLLATSGMTSPSSDSTMEELQAAIQAAIAHCKNSIAAETKKSPDLSVPVN